MVIASSHLDTKEKFTINVQYQEMMSGRGAPQRKVMEVGLNVKCRAQALKKELRQ